MVGGIERNPHVVVSMALLMLRGYLTRYAEGSGITRVEGSSIDRRPAHSGTCWSCRSRKRLFDASLRMPAAGSAATTS